MQLVVATCRSTTSRPPVHLRNTDGICTRMLIHRRGFDAQNRREEFSYRAPALTFVVRVIELAAACTEVEPCRLQRVGRERIAQHRKEAVGVG